MPDPLPARLGELIGTIAGWTIAVTLAIGLVLVVYGRRAVGVCGVAYFIWTNS